MLPSELTSDHLGSAITTHNNKGAGFPPCSGFLISVSSVCCRTNLIKRFTTTGFEGDRLGKTRQLVPHMETFSAAPAIALSRN